MASLTAERGAHGGREEESPSSGSARFVSHNRTSAIRAAVAVARLVVVPAAARVRPELAGCVGVDGLYEELVGSAVTAGNARITMVAWKR